MAAAALHIGCCAVLLSGCQSLSLARSAAAYERTLDAYAQTDATVTNVTNTRHADGRQAGLISAFFGLDNALPKRITDRVACQGAGGADGMPVIFSHEVDIASLDLAELDAAIAGADPLAEIEANHAALEAAGGWGVPTMVFNGEPFFGQDRIDTLRWRLEKSGVAKLLPPRETLAQLSN